MAEYHQRCRVGEGEAIVDPPPPTGWNSSSNVISITSTVLSSVSREVLNLLDTPGHRDFSEDTYRVLAATDTAIMVLDGSKGIESDPQTVRGLSRSGDSDRHLHQ